MRRPRPVRRSVIRQPKRRPSGQLVNELFDEVLRRARRTGDPRLKILERCDKRDRRSLLGKLGILSVTDVDREFGPSS